MAFAVHRAEIEKLIAERVALLVLREYALQREREFAQACSFGPVSLLLLVFRELNV